MSQQKKYNNPVEATLTGIRDLYKKGKPSVFLDENARLDGLTVMITGSSSGLGFAVAKDLAKRGASLIMPVRSGIPEKGEAVKAFAGHDQVSMYRVDLSDFQSIDNLLDELERDGVTVDIFISNAAMVPSGMRTTKQGLEEMFMVNYVAAFYLTNQLLERGMIKSESPDYPRIIFVASESHRNPPEFNWDKFGVIEDYGMKETVNRYGYYKLMLVTYARELGRRLNQNGVVIPVRSLCPGPVNSNIARESPGFFKPLLKLVFKLFFKSPEDAAGPVIYFATEKDAKDREMDYLFLMNERPIDEKAENAENGQKLWKMTEELIKTAREDQNSGD